VNSFYDDLNLMAKELLAEFDGRSVKMKIIRRVAGAVSLTTGKFEIPEGDDDEIAITGIISPYRKGQISGADIQAGDLLAIIDSQVEQLSSDQMLVDARTYSIVAIQRVKPSDQALIYKVQLRQ